MADAVARVKPAEDNIENAVRGRLCFAHRIQPQMIAGGRATIALIHKTTKIVSICAIMHRCDPEFNEPLKGHRTSLRGSSVFAILIA